MTQYQITIDEELLQGLFEGDEGLAKLMEEVLNQVLDGQVSENLQAGWYERTDDRQGYRNGYRTRNMKTRVGTLELEVPRVRNGHFSTELFSRYQRSEQALVLSLMEMVINGVSTRKVKNITRELCGTEFKKSTVSNLCKRLDPIVEAWNERDLDGEAYPFVLVDAMQLKIRINNRVIAQSGFIAVGINEDGYRELLGLQLGNSESETSWSEYFRWLKGRGLSGVDLVVSDDHGGLVKAVRKHFQGVAWQRCQTHLKRNVLDKVPDSKKDEVAGRLKLLFDAPDKDTARDLLDDVLSDYSELRRAMNCLEEGFEDATAVMALPKHYRKRLRSTNMVERLIREIRRREKVIGIFPNRKSAERLLGAYIMERDEEWITGRRYFNMQKYWQWKQTQKEKPAQLNDEAADD